jgi:hypothetical protein
MRNCVKRSVVAATALLMFGCGTADEEAETAAPYTAELGEAPPELVLGGRRYVRLELLSEADREELRNPGLWEKSNEIDNLAQLLRGVVIHMKHGQYIEAEPNVALARISLGLDRSPLPPQAGLIAPDGARIESKSVTADGDQRSRGNSTSWPSNAYALSESGGTGTMVGWRIYTAGHVIFNNSVVAGVNGWLCRDNSTTPLGTEPSCSAAGHPAWRFGGRLTVSGGVETQTWATPWALCGYKNVPVGWINLPSTASSETLARWDYGFQNLDGCIPAGTGNLGWWVTDQATLRLTTIWQAGYALLFACPALALGGSTASTDCPGGTVQLRPVTATRPFTGGSLFWTNGGTDANLVVTGGYIQSSRMDATSGHSGGAVIAWDSGTSTYWAVGTASNTAGGQSNTNYNHLTSEVLNFIYQ